MMKAALLVSILLLSLSAAGCKEQSPKARPDSGVAPLSSSTEADEPIQGDSLVVVGTLIDTRCFSLDRANLRADHIRDGQQVKACAQACANLGFPVAVLENGDPANDPWVLITVSQALADYMAGTVRVTGIVRSAGVLIPERIELQVGNEWTFIL